MENLQLFPNQYQPQLLPTSSQNTITADLFNSFISYLDVKPKSTETYTRALRQLFTYFSFKGINSPTREDILAYREKLKLTCKPTTVQNYITAAKLFFRWTQQEKIYPNIAEHIKGAKLDRKHKKDYLTSKQVKEVLSSIDRNTVTGLRDYAILTLMTTGGLRTIEVSRANTEDLRTLGDNTVLYVQGKGQDEKAEYVKVSTLVEKAIREYLCLKTDAKESSKGNEPLFISTSNNSRNLRLSVRSVSGIVKARLKSAGFNSERLTAHSLRHTAVTLSLLAGKDITEVQQFARHSNITTTQIYNHALERAENSCGEAISSVIFSN